jgi:hypothetical protein
LGRLRQQWPAGALSGHVLRGLGVFSASMALLRGRCGVVGAVRQRGHQLVARSSVSVAGG